MHTFESLKVFLAMWWAIASAQPSEPPMEEHDPLCERSLIQKRANRTHSVKQLGHTMNAEHEMKENQGEHSTVRMKKFGKGPRMKRSRNLRT